jgi:acetyl-CoA C-acetyltransferase
LIDVALVVGVEKVTDRVGSSVDAAMAMAADADHESVQGLTPTAQAGLLMRRYLHEFGAPDDALAGFSLTAHANAVHSSHAFLRREISLEDYRSAPRESDPLNLYDAAPLADGAAALVLARREALLPPDGRPWVRVAGSAVAITALAIHDQPDVLGLDAAERSARAVFEQAGLKPEDIDVFELHDAFSIYAALALESSGFAPRGQGWRLAADGHIGLNGRIPCMTFGGSKARGEVGGATGLYQAAEVVLQVQERAGTNQVPGARIGMAQCIGGAGATVATHVFALLEP